MRLTSLRNEALEVREADVEADAGVLLATKEVCPHSDLNSIPQSAIVQTFSHMLFSILAFRDRDAGNTNSRGKPVDDGIREDRHPHRGGREYNRAGRGRGGGRGREFRDGRDDRHNHGRPKYRLVATL